MFWIIAIGLVLYYLYTVIIQPHKVWKNKGVKHVAPTLLLGNMTNTKTKSMSEITQDAYNLFPKERYIGLYQFLTPVLMLKDLDLIKTVTIKEFDSFVDHRDFIDAEQDPLWGKNLFAMNGDNWREMRSTLSPAFTSNKMRLIYDLMESCATQVTDYLKSRNEDIVEIQAKDLFTRFTNDVIALSAFGLKCNSLKEPTNEFYMMGKEATDFRSSRFVLLFLLAKAKFISKMINLKVITTKVGNFFTSVIEDTIRTRKENNIVRPDMIHLLLEAQKGRLKHEGPTEKSLDGFATVEESEIGKKQVKGKTEISNVDITAQALIFFLAGFDTVSTAMTFATYEIAVNPDVQQKLFAEIEETLKGCDGKLNYDALLGMKYLDMVVSETLRKWPPANFTDRQCVKDFDIEPVYSDEKVLHVDKGTTLWIPVYAIHRDPKYYPNPETFDPERFSEENKHQINPTSYLPFGIGPRNCIGSRFALLETKLVLFNILRDFEIVPIEKTQIPLKLNPKIIPTSAMDGVMIGMKKRN